jgi:hypothetical protein
MACLTRPLPARNNPCSVSKHEGVQKHRGLDEQLGGSTVASTWCGGWVPSWCAQHQCPSRTTRWVMRAVCGSSQAYGRCCLPFRYQLSTSSMRSATTHSYTPHCPWGTSSFIICCYHVVASHWKLGKQLECVMGRSDVRPPSTLMKACDATGTQQLWCRIEHLKAA